MSSFNRVKVNQFIKALELRVIGPEGENIGIIGLREALEKAHEAGLDLIEISPNATPPVAKIMDYGKFKYLESKKEKQARAKTQNIETKSVQVKIGTGEHDLELKAKKTSDWLREGHRVKINLFLIGRSKYMDFQFLKERLERILKLVSVEHKVAEPPKKSPKGITTIIEKV
ncbi:MAG: translation initiation factor IF-3 [Candidatus Taylorbacteria bacterium RIFCSPLOWO2_01_FULL_45_15b]|uniref:Translation initiation factor IF-3 n=1 Tax=Candidatus Taylorbacteria bacterium RIFCSPLOWO2_01_FULL_45_15b TaxID=1802319 RepID=A0A1G2N7V8_9BACT|nr:MAG: translation initiation factor IF-3 [Candidatus Taylorbacteria bacterium RIFCSPLOWO2_01_FULL_45_15b]